MMMLSRSSVTPMTLSSSLISLIKLKLLTHRDQLEPLQQTINDEALGLLAATNAPTLSEDEILKIVSRMAKLRPPHIEKDISRWPCKHLIIGTSWICTISMSRCIGIARPTPIFVWILSKQVQVGPSNCESPNIRKSQANCMAQLTDYDEANCAIILKYLSTAVPPLGHLLQRCHGVGELTMVFIITAELAS